MIYLCFDDALLVGQLISHVAVILGDGVELCRDALQNALEQAHQVPNFLHVVIVESTLRPNKRRQQKVGNRLRGTAIVN